jgi:hypothetical protein
VNQTPAEDYINNINVQVKDVVEDTCTELLTQKHLDLERYRRHY